MPTSDMTGVDTLYSLHLPVSTFLGFALDLENAQPFEQALRLIALKLQRYVRSLHTFLLDIFGGFQRTAVLDLSNGTERQNDCQEL